MSSLPKDVLNLREDVVNANTHEVKYLLNVK